MAIIFPKCVKLCIKHRLGFYLFFGYLTILFSFIVKIKTFNYMIAVALEALFCIILDVRYVYS